MRAKFDFETKKVTPVEGSAILRDEAVLGIREYAPEKLLISTLKSRNLIKWEGLEKFTHVVGPLEANEAKFSIQTLPDFNEETFPFFLVTGKAQIWLGNVKTNRMQVLVQGSSIPYYGSDGVTFLDQRAELGKLGLDHS